jgi:hypothetical protein
LTGGSFPGENATCRDRRQHHNFKSGHSGTTFIQNTDKWPQEYQLPERGASQRQFGLLLQLSDLKSGHNSCKKADNSQSSHHVWRFLDKLRMKPLTKKSARKEVFRRP